MVLYGILVYERAVKFFRMTGGRLNRFRNRNGMGKETVFMKLQDGKRNAGNRNIGIVNGRIMGNDTYGKEKQKGTGGDCRVL